jgi:uncharacterized protein YjiS (DUF1127 family)
MSSLVNRLSGRRASRWVPPWPRMAVRRMAAAMVAYYDRARQRRALEGLDDRMLKDIGLSRADVHGECRKPFWRS